MLNFYFRPQSKINSYVKNTPPKYHIPDIDLEKDPLKKALAHKITKYNGNPETTLYISHPIMEKYSSKIYTQQYNKTEDRYLYCKLFEIGIDTENVYDKIKQMIENEPKFQYIDYEIFR